MKKARQVCRELTLGIVIWAAPVTLALLLITSWDLAVIPGVFVGSAGAAGIVYHMYHSLDIALDLPPGKARVRTQLAALKRLLAMGVLIAFSMLYSQYINPGGVIFGLFGIKVSALMYPKLHPRVEAYRKKKK